MGQWISSYTLGQGSRQEAVQSQDLWMSGYGLGKRQKALQILHPNPPNPKPALSEPETPKPLNPEP